MLKDVLSGIKKPFGNKSSMIIKLQKYNTKLRDLFSLLLDILFFLNIFLFVFYILQQTNKQKHEQGS